MGMGLDGGLGGLAGSLAGGLGCHSHKAGSSRCLLELGPTNGWPRRLWWVRHACEGSRTTYVRLWPFGPFSHLCMLWGRRVKVHSNSERWCVVLFCNMSAPWTTVASTVACSIYKVDSNIKLTTSWVASSARRRHYPCLFESSSPAVRAPRAYSISNSTVVVE